MAQQMQLRHMWPSRLLNWASNYVHDFMTINYFHDIQNAAWGTRCYNSVERQSRLVLGLIEHNLIPRRSMFNDEHQVYNHNYSLTRFHGKSLGSAF